MLSIGDTVISGICVALALCIAIPRVSKNRFFNCACLRYPVSLTVIIIIMNWFQATLWMGQPALQYVASGVIGFVVVHCLWSGEVKQLESDTNQLMGKLWDWNMYGTKLKKFHGWILHAANKDGDGDEDDATALPEDRSDGSKEGSSSGSDDHDGHEDCGVASDDSDYENELGGPRAVQLLAIRANFCVSAINAYDWHEGRCVYYSESQLGVQEEGMVDLVPTGPDRIIEAYGPFDLTVFKEDNEGSCTSPPIEDGWDVAQNDYLKEYTQTIDGGLGRKLEITYLVMPASIETHVEVRLNLKDLGSRKRSVYGSIKASAIDYGSKRIHLFNCERGLSWSFPCRSTCDLPLSPYLIALPYHRHFKLHIEVDLRVMTTCGSQEEEKNLSFCLDFTRRIRSQEREVDGDQVEVNVTWYLE
ncbi:hypothetical protein QOZ80_4BG0342730 [Eleusine coracana subsp. coracana]|nr:hypothetical protein QOZ80_4BG0342730 [Eleusine coracana subsp. coracana]